MSALLGKVVVLMGGTSAEREVSLMSGTAVMQALLAAGIDAVAFDPAERSLCDLPALAPDRVFIALHGRGGEDGSLQGALDSLRIAYTGSGVMASAIAMDKWRTKMIWQAAGLPTPKYRMLTAATDWAEACAFLGDTIFVKPAREGSSVGASKVAGATPARLRDAWAEAARHDDHVLAEEFVSGAELTCAFLGNEALPLVRIHAPGGNYDFQNKYYTDVVRYDCPSGLDASTEANLQRLVLEAARLLDCRGWGRADILLDEAGAPYLLEMNTSPGMTGHSLVPMAAAAAGISFQQLVIRILESAAYG